MTPRSSTAARPSRIWMDITTSLRAPGARPNGTLRVERTLATGLRSELGSALAFCSYSRGRRRFLPADISIFAREAASVPSSQRRSQKPDHLGKRIERLVRRAVRGWLQSARRQLAPRDAASLFPGLQAGDVLLLGGETWSARYDLDVIRRLKREASLKIVAICQDLIPLTHPQFFQSGEFVTRYRDYVDFLLDDADLLIVHSQSVRDGLLSEAARSRRAAPKIPFVPLGSDIAANVTPVAPMTRTPLQPDNFAIAVSTIQSRKNFDLLYRVWRQFAEEGRDDIPRLVIVGAPGFGGTELLQQIANDARVKDSIVVIHDAGDAELAWLYRNCRFTLYPSFAEGWGLPVSESLAYGKPCLASNTTSLPEAGAGLAVHLDPLDFQAWYDTILAWSTEGTALDVMTRDIAAHYRPTSWADTSAALARELRKLIA